MGKTLETNKLDDGDDDSQHTANNVSRGKKAFAYLPRMRSRRTRTVDDMGRKRREGWLQRCSLSYDQACCIHLPLVECYAIQAFSIASIAFCIYCILGIFMPKIQNQITTRKASIVIQSLLSRRPNHHPSYR